MNILLIHSSDLAANKKVQSWRNKKRGLGNIYQLSVVGLGEFDSLPSVEQDALLDFIFTQIGKARKLYSVEKVFVYHADGNFLEKLKALLAIRGDKTEVIET